MSRIYNNLINGLPIFFRIAASLRIKKYTTSNMYVCNYIVSCHEWSISLTDMCVFKCLRLFLVSLWQFTENRAYKMSLQCLFSLFFNLSSLLPFRICICRFNLLHCKLLSHFHCCPSLCFWFLFSFLSFHRSFHLPPSFI